MKRIIFLIIASLLVIGLVLPGCGEGGPAARPKIIIGIPYPAGSIQGDGMIKGAELAAQQINTPNAGINITVGGNSTIYDIQLVELNDNEIANPTAAWNTVDHLITVNDAQFIIGGFRTEAVEPMIQNVLKTEKVPFFVCGAATGELLSGGLSGDSIWPGGYGTPYYSYNSSSDYYKYVFRATPFNAGFLLPMVMTTFAQLSQDIQTAMGWTWNGTAFPYKLTIGIVGENLTWAIPILGGYQKLLAYGPYFGWSFCATTSLRTFSDSASAGVVDAALTDLQNAHCEVILTCMSGAVGKTFGTEMHALNITAIPVGINVEAQDPNYAINTGSQYEVTTGTWAQGVAQTGLTAAFLSAYHTYTNSFPVYTAASYDMVWTLKTAFEATNSVDKDVVSAYLLANPRTITSGVAQYYPQWDQVTHGLKLVTVPDSPHFLGYVEVPALNASQVAALYTTLGYKPIGTGFNYTMAPFTTNDLVFGPGYVTGICVQWLNGTQVGVWPNAGYDNIVSTLAPLKIQTTLVQALVGLNWSGALEYSGTSNMVIPAAYQATWHGWFP